MQASSFFTQFFPKSSIPGVGNVFRAADQFETEIFSRTGLQKNKCSAVNIYYNSCELLQLWFNENLELVLPQRDAPT